MNPLTYANFNFVIFSALISSKRTWKSPQQNFIFDQAYHIIIHTKKLKFISSIFNIHVFLLTKKHIFCFWKSVLIIPFIFSSLLFIYLFALKVLMIHHLPFTSIASSISFFWIFLNVLIIHLCLQIYIYPCKSSGSHITNHNFSCFSCT